MLGNVLVISRCLGKTYSSQRELHRFHFKGVLRGELISELHLSDQTNRNFIKGEDYVLYVKDCNVHKKIMRGAIIKAAMISEIKR